MAVNRDELLFRRLQSGPEVHSRSFGDELVLLDLVRGEYFSLDALGARIWSEIAAGRTASEVVDVLSPYYDVDTEELRVGVLELVAELVFRDLLVFPA
jgi:hypothetical protein